MKRKGIFLLGILLLGSVAGCKNDNSSSIIKNSTHGPIQYTDTLPNKTKDGNILHAFNWSFNSIKENLEAIANAGFTAVQTSPVQQPKAGGGAWWAFYQPVSFSIATSSPLGNKEELASLCLEADKYGVKIICDIVANHMATNGETDANGLPVIDPEIEKYEPEIYANSASTFHYNKQLAGSSGPVTQLYDGLPDLNTSNELVQERVLSLLKECIDCGVDGFRFDAAKHIETESDENYSSNFWSNTLGVAKEYYLEKTGNELFAYGEILNDVDGNRNIDYYTNHMLVTDNTYCSGVYAGLVSTNAEQITKASYGKNTSPSNLVTWVESHDTYVTASNHLADKFIAKEWAIIASRKDTRSLYFARPSDDIAIGSVNSYAFEDEIVAVTNRFHNRFLDAEEDLQSIDTIVYNERYSEEDFGVILVNLSSKVKEVEVEFKHLPDGEYYDTLSGNVVNIVNRKAKVNFDTNGIVVLTLTPTVARPTINVNKASTFFAGSIDVKITTNNAESATYQIDDGEVIAFNGTTTITLGENLEADEKVVLTVTAKNGDFTKTKKYTYTKLSLIEGYVNILNVKEEYFSDYELYIWMWGANYNPGLWTQDYEIRDGRLLFSKDKNAEGFLLAIFPKDYVIEKTNAWDSNVIKQSSDIKGNADYFDASSF